MSTRKSGRKNSEVLKKSCFYEQQSLLECQQAHQEEPKGSVYLVYEVSVVNILILDRHTN